MICRIRFSARGTAAEPAVLCRCRLKDARISNCVAGHVRFASSTWRSTRQLAPRVSAAPEESPHWALAVQADPACKRIDPQI